MLALRVAKVTDNKALTLLAILLVMLVVVGVLYGVSFITGFTFSFDTTSWTSPFCGLAMSCG